MAFGFLRSLVNPTGAYRREVAGTPKGGQFSPGYHAEVTMELTLREQDLNAEGTWDQPAYPTSAAALIDFWMNVPVPDEITERVLTRADAVDHAGTARMVARLKMIQLEMSRLPKEERTKVFRHPFQFPDGLVFNVYDGPKFYGAASPAVLPPSAFKNR